MRILSLFAVLLCASLKFYGQLPQVYLTTKQSQALGALSKTAPLVVVIENEKNEDDAALISAVKEQWRVGPVKYMSGLEFSEKYKAQSLDPSNLYLFNNYTRELKYSGGVVVTMNPGKLATVPAIFPGYYLTNEPNKLINSLKYKTAPPFLYFSSEVLKDKKQNPIKGFYRLMIKNFNYDIRYCQDDENFNPKKKKKRNKRRNGVYFFTNDSLSNKTFLLVKEQTTQKDKKAKEAEKKAQSSEKKKALSSDKYAAKKTVVVFPEDIDFSVKKSDADIMLFNGDCVYSAADGSVYATVRGHASKKGLALSIASAVLSVCAITFFVISIQR